MNISHVSWQANCANMAKESKCPLHKKKLTRCNNVSKFYYSTFIWSSTCSGRHTAHRREPKTALAASGFSYVEVVGHVVVGHCQAHCAWQRPPAFQVWKTRGRQCSFWLPTMVGVSPENMLSFIQMWNNKILIHCCILLEFSLWIVLRCTDPRTSNVLCLCC